MRWSDDVMDPICICEHEPHDGPCTERVMTGISSTGMTGTMPCGCEEYCPNRNND
jgi:hypothetical protein